MSEEEELDAFIGQFKQRLDSREKQQQIEQGIGTKVWSAGFESRLPPIVIEDAPKYNPFVVLPVVDCCLYPSTAGSTNLPDGFDAIIGGCASGSLDPQVASFTHSGVNFTGTAIAADMVTMYDVIIRPDGPGGSWLGHFDPPHYNLDSNELFIGFGGYCLINSLAPLPTPDIDNIGQSVDYFASSYFVDFGAGVTGTVNRVSICTWTGTASNASSITLTYDKNVTAFRLNGTIKTAPQTSPLGLYGSATVS